MSASRGRQLTGEGEELRALARLPAFLSIPLAAAYEGKNRDDLLFPDAAGGPMRTPTITEGSWWDRAVPAAGLPEMTINDLRHTAASLAISAGANVTAVQRMLGHASAAMTLDVYADLFDGDLDAVAVALDSAARNVGRRRVKQKIGAQRRGADR